MATYGEPRGIHLLFAKSVPHILERIFFSLDQESFDTCREVSIEWSQLLASAPFQRRYDRMLLEKRELEDELLESSCFGDAENVGRLLSIGVDKNCESGAGNGSGYKGSNDE